jgi:hypothetical protein
MKLIIADLNPNVVSTWSEILHGLPEISFVNIDFKTLVSHLGIDAILIRGLFAHERYGGRPEIDKSSIISTNGEVGMPPWVVTTPAFSQAEKPAPEDYDYTEFNKVFESIEQFNDECDQKQNIKTLAFEISFLYGFRDAMPYCKEAKGLKRAYIINYLRKTRI